MVLLLQVPHAQVMKQIYVHLVIQVTILLEVYVFQILVIVQMVLLLQMPYAQIIMVRKYVFLVNQDTI